jgi:hypothetical protein
MHSTLTAIAADAHLADLHRLAERNRSVPADIDEIKAPSLELRGASVDDGRALRRLAALDDARELSRPALIALLDGQPVAALSLADGRVVANPFVHTAEAVALLRLRAAQLAGAGHRPSTPRRSRLRRRHGAIVRAW